jgi:hypothetical protein
MRYFNLINIWFHFLTHFLSISVQDMYKSIIESKDVFGVIILHIFYTEMNKKMKPIIYLESMESHMGFTDSMMNL